MGSQIRCANAKCRRKFTPARATVRKYCFQCRPPRPSSTGTLATAPPPGPEAGRPDGELQRSVQAELERLEQVHTVAGAVALRLARSLDDPALGAAQVSSISAQLIRTLEPLQKVAPREPDGMDRRVEAALKLVRGA
jgi:hypothetical protein